MAVSYGQGVVGAQAIGAFASVIGSYYEAKAQKSALQMQADAARTTAALTDLTARSTIDTANLNADTTIALSALNIANTKAIAGLNIANIAAVSEFNSSIADGNYNLIMGRGELEAAAAETNAVFAERQAQDTLRAGQQKEQQSRLQYAALKGQQRARLAANGVVLDEGTSALRIITDTDYLSDVDASIIQTTAVNAALGYRMESVNYTTAAAAARLNAKSDALSNKIQAMGAKLNADGEIAGIQMSTSFDILQQDISAKLTAANTRTQAASDAFNLRIGATNYRNQAAGATLAARGISAVGSAATSLLTNGARVADKWYSYSKAGLI